MPQTDMGQGRPPRSEVLDRIVRDSQRFANKARSKVCVPTRWPVVRMPAGGRRRADARARGP